jgi:hypothetical protein
MKKWTYTLAFLSVISLIACSKKHTLTEDEAVTSLNAQGEVITSWESGYTWSQSDSADYIVFSHTRSMPEITSEILEKGVVLVALKNVPYKEDTLQKEPKLVPFSVIPYYGHDQQGKPIYDQHWYIIPAVGSVTIKYRTNRHNFSELPLLPPDGRVEARYFILSEAQLKRLGHSQASIKDLTYKKLVGLLGTSE